MRTRTTPQQDVRRRHERRDSHAVPRRPARSGEDRVRAAGGPQDLAYYRCDCGYSFSGDVSTHVACPHCGTDQAW